MVFPFRPSLIRNRCSLSLVDKEKYNALKKDGDLHKKLPKSHREVVDQLVELFPGITRLNPEAINMLATLLEGGEESRGELLGRHHILVLDFKSSAIQSVITNMKKFAEGIKSIVDQLQQQLDQILEYAQKHKALARNNPKLPSMEGLGKSLSRAKKLDAKYVKPVSTLGPGDYQMGASQGTLKIVGGISFVRSPLDDCKDLLGKLASKGLIRVLPDNYNDFIPRMGRLDQVNSLDPLGLIIDILEVLKKFDEIIKALQDAKFVKALAAKYKNFDVENILTTITASYEKAKALIHVKDKEAKERGIFDRLINDVSESQEGETPLQSEKDIDLLKETQAKVVSIKLLPQIDQLLKDHRVYSKPLA